MEASVDLNRGPREAPWQSTSGGPDEDFHGVNARSSSRNHLIKCGQHCCNITCRDEPDWSSTRLVINQRGFTSWSRCEEPSNFKEMTDTDCSNSKDNDQMTMCTSAYFLQSVLALHLWNTFSKVTGAATLTTSSMW